MNVKINNLKIIIIKILLISYIIYIEVNSKIIIQKITLIVLQEYGEYL